MREGDTQRARQRSGRAGPWEIAAFAAGAGCVGRHDAGDTPTRGADTRATPLEERISPTRPLRRRAAHRAAGEPRRAADGDRAGNPPPPVSIGCGRTHGSGRSRATSSRSSTTTARRSASSTGT